MVGQLANRAQFGLILPSTNTSVEAEFNRMLVPGTYPPSNCLLPIAPFQFPPIL